MNSKNVLNSKSTPNDSNNDKSMDLIKLLNNLQDLNCLLLRKNKTIEMPDIGEEMGG